MMKEKYESLSLATLRDLAKARGLKGVSTLRKKGLIERMLEEDVNEVLARVHPESKILGAPDTVKKAEESEIAPQQENESEPEKSPEKTEEKAPEKTFERDTEKASEKNSERSTERTPERNFERSAERTPERNFERSAERTPERNFERSAERTPERNFERSTDRMPERSFERNTERSYENNAGSQTRPPIRTYSSYNRNYGNGDNRNYGNNNRNYGNNNRGYGNERNYRNNDSRYNNENRGYANNETRTYGNSDNRYSAENRGYGNNNENRSYGNNDSRSYGNNENRYSNDNRNYSNNENRSYTNNETRGYANNDSRNYGSSENHSYVNNDSRGYSSNEIHSYVNNDNHYTNTDSGNFAGSENNVYEQNNDGSLERVQDRNQISDMAQLDSGEKANGILEVLPDGYGFIRCENYMPGENDIYVSPSQIRRFNLKTGDILQGNIRIKTQGEKFSALLYVSSINGFHPNEGQKRFNFEDMTPIFPNERLKMERPGGTTAMRIVDLISPIGKGQRGMIVSPPKAGKTTLLKDVAKSIQKNNPNMHLIILLIDERPEEVTDIKEAITGENVEVIYSTFDETPEHHKRVSEMVIERARRLVEHRTDVTILLDSITRLARAYNLIIPPSGRTLSGGLDPAALHMPKRFFGAARNMREGGSLTILATALVETGSKMDDVIYEEFKGTGNMELVLDRRLQEKRVFPAIDIQKSGTRREDLLLNQEEQEAVYMMRKALNGMKSEDAAEQILNMFAHTKDNAEFVQTVKKQKWF